MHQDLMSRQPLTRDDIVVHPRFAVCLKQQARTLLAVHATNRRATATFATQQRWLLAHIALAQYFKGVSVGAGFYAEPYLETVVRYGVASANTAGAFLKEMQHYGFVLPVEGSRDRRIQWLAPAPGIIELISAWLSAHLGLLDGLDDGDRCETFAARPGLIGRIQPLIADALVHSPSIREPQPVFSLFTWLNEGGIVMDWLYAGLGDALDPPARIATSVRQLADINALVQLSRTHLARKLRAAEEMGSLGWLGKRGQSQMWVSREFVGQYEAQQATKLAIIDAAFAAVLCPGEAAVRSV